MVTPNDPEQERLDELEAGIAAARRRAEEHGTIPSPHHERTLIDPDGDGNEDDSPGTIGG